MSLIVNSENKSNSRTKPISTTLIKDSKARDPAFYAPVEELSEEPSAEK